MTLTIGRFSRRRSCSFSVTLANHQLHVLQQHPAKGRDRFRVLVGIQRNEQNQFLVNDFVERQHLIVGASDDGEFVLEKVISWFNRPGSW